MRHIQGRVHLISRMAILGVTTFDEGMLGNIRMTALGDGKRVQFHPSCGRFYSPPPLWREEKSCEWEHMLSLA